MAARLKSVTTIGNTDYPALFSQPGLAVPNYQGDITILLQNCGDVDIEIPRCTAIGYLENLQNKSFNEIYAVDEQKIEDEAAKTNPSVVSTGTFWVFFHALSYTGVYYQCIPFLLFLLYVTS